MSRGPFCRGPEAQAVRRHLCLIKSSSSEGLPSLVHGLKFFLPVRRFRTVPKSEFILVLPIFQNQKMDPLDVPSQKADTFPGVLLRAVRKGLQAARLPCCGERRRQWPRAR